MEQVPAPVLADIGIQWSPDTATLWYIIVDQQDTRRFFKTASIESRQPVLTMFERAVEKYGQWKNMHFSKNYEREQEQIIRRLEQYNYTSCQYRAMSQQVFATRYGISTFDNRYNFWTLVEFLATGRNTADVLMKKPFLGPNTVVVARWLLGMMAGYDYHVDEIHSTSVDAFAALRNDTRPLEDIGVATGVIRALKQHGVETVRDWYELGKSGRSRIPGYGMVTEKRVQEALGISFE